MMGADSGSRPSDQAPAGLDAPRIDPERKAEVAILFGYVEEVYNKRGLRTIHFEAIYPYTHRVCVQVTGDPGAEDDNALTAALQPYCLGLVRFTADVDAQGDLSSTPARFAIVSDE